MSEDTKVAEWPKWIHHNSGFNEQGVEAWEYSFCNTPFDVDCREDPNHQVTTLLVQHLQSGGYEWRVIYEGVIQGSQQVSRSRTGVDTLEAAQEAALFDSRNSVAARMRDLPREVAS